MGNSSGNIKSKFPDPVAAEGADTHLSLWLVPAGDGLHRLQGLIAVAATQYHGATFQAHMPLLDGVMVNYEDGANMEDVLGRAWYLAQELEPFQVEVKDIEGYEPWNQCLVAVTDHCREFDRANIGAQRLLRQGASSASRPLFPEPAKQPYLPIALATELGQEEVRQNAVAWVKEEHPWVVEDFKFTVCSVALWMTSSTLDGASEWKEIADFPFQSGQ